MTPPGLVPDTDIAIIGAGAAGLATAIFAAEQAATSPAPVRITLIDGARKPGAKILVSGGGRCNVTNESLTPDDYCGGSRNIIRNVLKTFNEQHTLAWMQSLGVDLKLEPTGKYFPVSDSSRTVLAALMDRVEQLGIEPLFGGRVQGITPPADTPHWTITFADGLPLLSAHCVVLATGGRALPKSGSDGVSYDWLRLLGHRIITPVPALAPLVLDAAGLPDAPLSGRFADLSGLTLDARLEFVVGGQVAASFTGSTLFTHFGLSGPAPMNLSRHIARHRQANPKSDPGHLRLAMPAFADASAAETWLREQAQTRPKTALMNLLKEVLPTRMAELLLERQPNPRLSELGKLQRAAMARALGAGFPFAVNGDRGYSFAEATAGGVDLAEVNWRTMESRVVPGLFLCGEVLDVDGRIGGFNFQWAWSTGNIAGHGATDYLRQHGGTAT